MSSSDGLLVLNASPSVPDGYSAMRRQIAYLLGENAADSEIILNSIERSFSSEELDERGLEKSK